MIVKNQICGEMNIAGIGAAQATVTGKLADSATKGNTIQLGSFKKIDAEDAYQIYKAANHD